ncbi:putative nervy, partial [Operophtera brumata]
FYETPQTNGSHEDYVPHAKRPPPASLFLNPSFLYPGGNAGLFDYGHAYHGYHGQSEPAFERRDVRDVSSMNAPFSEPRLAGPGAGALLKTDDEWRNINTMLNCILSMEFEFI